ncbi:MAG: iron ABC transporter substrate-binding protein [Rhizobiaceae bacterium]
MKKLLMACLAMAVAAPAAFADELTIYSGRGEALIGPVIAEFQRATGITANVRYGGTAELAALLQEEGERSPADVFWAQDGGALGALESYFAALPAEVNEGVTAPFRNANDKWVATSGRSRVVAYSPERVEEAELPASIMDLTDEKYRGRVAWAPTNGSFQAWVTALRVTKGDDVAREWLEGMVANDARTYRNNTTQIEGIANGEVDFALVNNYYLGRFIAADADFPVAQTHFEAGDIGNFLSVAGVGIVAASDNQDNARAFIDYLLSESAQQYITLQGNEYPVVPGVIFHSTLEPFDTLLEITPEVDINDISDLDGTLNLLREVGLL